MKLVFLLILLVISFRGQASMIVAPAFFEGQANEFSENLSIEIYNTGTKKETLQVELVSLTQRENGAPQFLSLDKPLLIPETNIIEVDAKQKAVLKVKRVDCSQAIYQAILLKRISEDSQTTAPAVAVLVMLAAAEDRPQGEVVGFDLAYGKWNEPQRVEVMVKNNGSSHFKAQGEICLTDNKGERVGQIVLQPGIILPGAKRNLEGILTSESLNEGTLCAQLDLFVGDSKLAEDLGQFLISKQQKLGARK